VKLTIKYWKPVIAPCPNLDAYNLSIYPTLLNNKYLIFIAHNKKLINKMTPIVAFRRNLYAFIFKITQINA
jgi:hypothetical protein